MKTSVEISYYPLKKEFIDPIKNFISNLEKQSGVEVKRNSMSTQLFGEYEDVMVAVTRCMKDAFELPGSVFVLKVINSDRSK